MRIHKFLQAGGGQRSVIVLLIAQSSLIINSAPNCFEVILFSDESFQNCLFVLSKREGGVIQWITSFCFGFVL